MDPLAVLTLISTAVQVAGSVKGLLDQGGVTKQCRRRCLKLFLSSLKSAPHCSRKCLPKCSSSLRPPRLLIPT